MRKYVNDNLILKLSCKLYALRHYVYFFLFQIAAKLIISLEPYKRQSDKKFLIAKTLFTFHLYIILIVHMLFNILSYKTFSMIAFSDCL